MVPTPLPLCVTYGMCVPLASSELGKALYGDYTPFVGRLSSMANVLGLSRQPSSSHLTRTFSMGAMPVFAVDTPGVSNTSDAVRAGCPWIG
jgi:hypothetical protein